MRIRTPGDGAYCIDKMLEQHDFDMDKTYYIKIPYLNDSSGKLTDNIDWQALSYLQARLEHYGANYNLKDQKGNNVELSQLSTMYSDAATTKKLGGEKGVADAMKYAALRDARAEIRNKNYLQPGDPQEKRVVREIAIQKLEQVHIALESPKDGANKKRIDNLKTYISEY